MMLESPLPFWIFTFLKVICAFSLEMVGSSLHSRTSEIYNYVHWSTKEPSQLFSLFFWLSIVFFFRCLLIQRDEKLMGPLNLDTCFPWLWKSLIYFLIIPSSLGLLDWSVFFQLFSVFSFFTLFCILGHFLVTASQAVFEFNTLSIMFLIPKNVSFFPVVPFLSVLIPFYGCNIFLCISKDSGWRFFLFFF